MSWSAPRSFSESIDGIASRWWLQVGLESRPVDHIDWPLEQACNKLLQANVIVDGPFGAGLEFDQNVEVAVRAVVAARNRAEHGRVRDAASAQGAFMSAKCGDSVLNVHSQNIAQGDPAGNLMASSGATMSFPPEQPLDVGELQFHIGRAAMVALAGI